MHFITGGAFNGKRQWVKETYLHESQREYVWACAYDGDSLSCDDSSQDIMILEGMEHWMKQCAGNYGAVLSSIEHWLEWERNKEGRLLLIIGTDISKGIVPVDEEDRTWRDETGRLYQYMVKKSEKAYVLWFGIAKLLKGREKE
ncbi:bifunctional adenosylcobinamide kinase/adenosylcobinamide-phosphate guanylyltransferase [Thalassorhabdus alkalitolerans]|uniref:Bifunctional adenosylcobinamide kinase/adenosylcobinamide-phosphate guanylyltransferase n=1 Tax=Thalassorhabdus alkalitolerans TaxID=2282697 RepID=A0ABW0YNU2_9BACI